ncbi:probable multidrug ABC transporter [Mesoplasma florum L1]|uniref:Probable multidrug ABC transporter n=1 Tax=Mesoplasma florum (strain ATCC 33453 / NBRC 100688 / NCTC 11704 / L1) TaxID=265311 RepID=Q6F141_MESFL|nr:ABC transporter B family permease/ATP-binding protein [Mesoplasma florum]AAT75782.1 probable multidrug ABC transporter [Mesoplasma florum L1]
MKTNKKTSQNAEFFKIISKYYLKYWWITIILALTILSFCLTRASIPLLTQQITLAIKSENKVVLNDAEQALFWGWSSTTIIIVAVVMILIDAIGTFIFNYFSYILGRKIEIDLRNKILEKLVRQDISYYSDKKIGEILTSVVADTQNLGDGAVRIPTNIGISLSQFVVAFTMTFILAWKIAIFGSIIYFLLLALYFVFYIQTVKKYAVVREVYEEVNGNVTDRVGTIRLIKSTGTEDYEKAYLEKQQDINYKAHKPAILNLSFLMTTVYAGSMILQFAIPIIAGIIYSIKGDTAASATFFSVTFPAYMINQASLIATYSSLMGITFSLAVAGVASVKVSNLLKDESRLDPHYTDGIIVDEIKGDIVFKDIEFRYPEKPEKLILPKFNFTFEEGKSYAFVGETGSGKSTIARLLLRFYDPSNGEIIINKDQNLKDLNLSSYLRHVGYVEQEPQILFGDVYENVKYGRFDATNEEVIEACKKAEIHKLISSWPEGYDTILGERGFMLSGGQKQRLVIARMILKNPQILILDEATSALDNIVEKEIQAKLNELMKGRTSFTIAHRLSTIKNVDHIIVLGGNAKGIVQQGTFKELVKVEGHFKNLYEAGLLEEQQQNH